MNNGPFVKVGVSELGVSETMGKEGMVSCFTYDPAGKFWVRKKGGRVRRVEVSGLVLWDSPKISYGVFVFG